MRKILILFSLVTQAGLAQQDTLTLLECYNRVVEVHPITGNKTLLEGITALKLKNYSAAFYPMFNLYAQATYQSDVTSLEVDLPLPDVEFPHPTKDQYKIAMDINQVLYDGGATRNRKELEKQQLETDLQKTEVTLHQLRESVNTLYFSILMLQEQEKILKLTDEVITERIKVARSSVENGVMMSSDLLALQAEQVKLKQQRTATAAGMKSGFNMLGGLLEMDLDRHVALEFPVIGIDPDKGIGRPEILLFKSQISQIEKSGDLLRSSRLPKLYAFGQVGYGRPGLNMLSETFEPYYLIGARISWNPFDWKVNRREQQVLELQYQQVNNQLDAFNLSVETELEKYRSDILKYEELIRSDDTLIELRSRIVESSTSKFDNGIINSADYLVDLNEEKQAKINREIHRIRMIQAQAEYLIKTGNQ